LPDVRSIVATWFQQSAHTSRAGGFCSNKTLLPIRHEVWCRTTICRRAMQRLAPRAQCGNLFFQPVVADGRLNSKIDT